MPWEEPGGWPLTGRAVSGIEEGDRESQEAGAPACSELVDGVVQLRPEDAKLNPSQLDPPYSDDDHIMHQTGVHDAIHSWQNAIRRTSRAAAYPVDCGKRPIPAPV